MMNVFKKYPLIMRPLILIGMASGFIPLILIPLLLIRENWDDYLDALIECYEYIWKGIK